MANSIFIDPFGTSIAGTITFTGIASFADGTNGAPSIAFTSEPGLGFFKSAAATISVPNGKFLLSQSYITTAGGQYFLGGSGGPSLTAVGTAGTFNIQSAGALGVNINVSALPTVASGFGTSPAIIAGSTPLAGGVNVGTGGIATSGVINFNGTAFPSAPFVVAMNTTTGAILRATATTTQLTITATVAFTASDIVNWICFSSK